MRAHVLQIIYVAAQKYFQNILLFRLYYFSYVFAIYFSAIDMSISVINTRTYDILGVNKKTNQSNLFLTVKNLKIGIFSSKYRFNLSLLTS